MKKWYQRCTWMLVAGLALQLSGCARSSAFLSRITGRQKDDHKLVDVDGKAKTKKTDSSKNSSKKSDPLREKASDSQLAKKSSTKAKVESRDTVSREVASAKPETKPAKKATLGDSNDPFASEEFQALTAAAEPTRKSKKDSGAWMDDAKANETRSLDQESTRVQEVAHKVEDNLADLPEWATEPQSPLSQEFTSPRKNIEKAQTASNEFLTEANSDVGHKTLSSRESSPKRDSKTVTAEAAPASSDLVAKCPDAQGELRELIGGLDTNDVDGLKRGVHRIGRMGPAAAAAAPAMIGLLKHNDGFVRTHAALALARMQASHPEAVKTVVDGLKSTDPGLRSFSAAVLAEMGPQAAEALSTLAESLKDQDGYVRLHAAEVLIRYDRWSYQALETLLNGLTDKDENIRWLATYSLAELAPESQETVDALIAATRDPVMKVKVGAVYALGEIGPFAKSATDSLRKLADTSTNQELHSVILNSLQQIEQ